MCGKYGAEYAEQKHRGHSVWRQPVFDGRSILYDNADAPTGQQLRGLGQKLTY